MEIVGIRRLIKIKIVKIGVNKNESIRSFGAQENGSNQGKHNLN
jgi:hypothetical protein